MENKITCIGELLIDFICSDIDSGLVQGSNFIKKAGGAPANVTAAISKLGGKATFVGKVGKDAFGDFLKNTLEEVGVDTSSLVMDEKSNTTLAFVSLKKDGERDFIFNRGGDGLLSFDEIDIEGLKKSKIIHFGSATALLGGPSLESYRKVRELAVKENIFISFDPNYRVDLWKNRIEEFIALSKEFISYGDFVKVSEEEIELISGKSNIYEGLEVFHSLGAKNVAVTLGKKGTLISNGREKEIIPSIDVNSIDSTGAGDAFVGGVLYKIAALDNAHHISRNFLLMKEIIKFSNKVGALTCTKFGAISALPTLEQVEEV